MNESGGTAPGTVTTGGPAPLRGPSRVRLDGCLQGPPGNNTPELRDQGIVETVIHGSDVRLVPGPDVVDHAVRIQSRVCHIGVPLITRAHEKTSSWNRNPRGHGPGGADPRPTDRGRVFAVIFGLLFVSFIDGILTLTQWYSLKRFIYCIHYGVAVAIEPPLLRTVLIEDGK